MQLYPGWSARDNYGYGSKKKKRKKDRSPAELGGTAERQRRGAGHCLWTLVHSLHPTVRPWSPAPLTNTGDLLASR